MIYYSTYNPPDPPSGTKTGVAGTSLIDLTSTSFAKMFADAVNYNAGTSYSKGTLVYDQNAIWVYVNDTSGAGNPPPTLPTISNAYWELVGSAGTFTWIAYADCPAGFNPITTVNIAGTAGQFTCAATTIAIGDIVTVSGSLGGTGTIPSYSNPTNYLVSATNGTTTFTLTKADGSALPTTIGTTAGLTLIKYTLSNFTTGTPGTRAYMGMANNKTSATEGINAADYTWTKFVGADGVSGVSPIYISINKPAVPIPTDSDGLNQLYTGSADTRIYVAEGQTTLEYDGVGTSNGTWKILSSTVTAGTITAGTTQADSASYAILNAVSGMTTDTATIQYTIQGKNSSGFSFTITTSQTFTKIKGAVVDILAPGIPAGLTTGSITSSTITTPAGDIQVKLLATWTANADADLSYYEVQIKEGAGSYISYNALVNSYEWFVKPNTSYTIQVRAVDKSENKSAYCTPVTVTTTKDTTAPALPTGITATAAFKNMFLSWTNAADADLSEVQIFENTTNTISATPVATVNARPSDIGGFTRSGLTTGTTYYYWLKSVDSSGNISAATTSVSVTPSVVSNVDITANTITGDRIQSGTFTGDRFNTATSLPGTITVGVTGVSIGTVQTQAATGAADPVGRINAGSTTIDPGKILISGTTYLSSWRNGTDNTKIEGGSIAANTVSANVLKVGLRGIDITGLNFQCSVDGAAASTNIVTWTAGQIIYTDDAGAVASSFITAGNSGTWTTGIMYFYWTKGGTTIGVTTAAGTAYTANNVVLATYAGGFGLVTSYGKTIIDGSQITTGTITGTQVKANSITATQINSNGLSIKDASGNVVFSAGSTVDFSSLSTSFPGSTNTSSVSNSAITISGGAISGIGTGSGTSIDNNYSLIGQNILPNSDCAQYHGWLAQYNPNGAVISFGPGFAKNYGGWTISNYVLAGTETNNLYVYQTGIAIGTVDGSGDNAVATDVIPYEGGNLISMAALPNEQFIASAYIGNHRCKGSVFVAFYNSAGTTLQYNESTRVGPTNANTNVLSLYNRAYVKATAPAGTAYVRLFVRKFNTLAGNSDSWLWWAAPQLERVNSGVTTPSPYQPGPVSSTRQLGFSGDLNATYGATFGSNIGGQITSANASTYIANAAIAEALIGNLSAGKITTGTLNTSRLNIDGISLTNSGGALQVSGEGITTSKLDFNAANAVALYNSTTDIATSSGSASYDICSLGNVHVTGTGKMVVDVNFILRAYDTVNWSFTLKRRIVGTGIGSWVNTGLVTAAAGSATTQLNLYSSTGVNYTSYFTTGENIRIGGVSGGSIVSSGFYAFKGTTTTIVTFSSAVTYAASATIETQNDGWTPIQRLASNFVRNVAGFWTDQMHLKYLDAPGANNYDYKVVASSIGNTATGIIDDITMSVQEVKKLA